MEKIFFNSQTYPEMNTFWARIQMALDNNTCNPKPQCQGFYLAYWNSEKKLLIAEKIGIVAKEKEFKYLNFACKKLTQTLMFGAISSRGYDDDCPQGSFIIKNSDEIRGAAVSGHDPEIDEAIALLWLITKRKIESFGGHEELVVSFISSQSLFSYLEIEARKIYNKFARGNQWITTLAGQMAEMSTE